MRAETGIMRERLSHSFDCSVFVVLNSRSQVSGLGTRD